MDLSAWYEIRRMSVDLFVEDVSWPIERRALFDALLREAWAAYAMSDDHPRLRPTREGSLGEDPIIGWRTDAPDAAELEAVVLRETHVRLEGALRRQAAGCMISPLGRRGLNVWTSAGRRPLDFELQKAVWRALGRATGGRLVDPQGMSEEMLAPVTNFEYDEPAAVGVPAPPFSLLDQNENQVDLTSIRGQSVVLWFLVSATAQGTIEEARSVARAAALFERRNILVLGIGFDSPEEHRKLAAASGLSFPLLSDPSRAAALAYGACTSSAAGYPERLVVVIGADGRVLRRFIRPKDPGAFVRAALAAP